MEGGRRGSWLNLPDRESVAPTSAESIGVGPGPWRLAGVVGASQSSAPLCQGAEGLDLFGLPPSHVPAKVPYAVLPIAVASPAPNGPSAELVLAVVEMKQRNPRWGCRRIAQQIALPFNLPFDKDVVRRILAHHYLPESASGGPSWLRLLDHPKDSLRSMNLSRCKSATLRTGAVDGSHSVSS
jgi:hypothetical protein